MTNPNTITPGDRLRAIRFHVHVPEDATGPDEHGLVRDWMGDVITVDDNVTVPPGTEGTVRLVDEAGSIAVRWDNGSLISLLPALDEWELVAYSCGCPAPVHVEGCERG